LKIRGDPPGGALALISRLALALVTLAAGADAQTAPVQPRVSFSITLGTIGYGDLQAQPVLAERLVEDENGETMPESAVLRRSVSVERGVHAAGSVAVALDAYWSVRAGVGGGRVRLGHGFAGVDPWTAEAAAVPVAGGTDVALASVEAALRFRLPSAHTLRPYLEVGVAAERWRARGPGLPFPGASEIAEGVTRIGGHAALGAHYPVTERWVVRAQASTRVFRTPLDPAPAGGEVGRTEGFVITFQQPAAGPFGDSSLELVQGLRLELGLSYAVGAAVAPPPDRSESDASRSARHR
jgi:hypothetical protein